MHNASTVRMGGLSEVDGGAWGQGLKLGYKETIVLLAHQLNGWPKSLQETVGPLCRIFNFPKGSKPVKGEGKCLGESKGEFIILLIYYHLPSEDNIDVCIKKQTSAYKVTKARE